MFASLLSHLLFPVFEVFYNLLCVCVCLQVSSVPLNRIDQIHVCFPPSSETLECAPKLVCLQHDTS